MDLQNSGECNTSSGETSPPMSGAALEQSGSTQSSKLPVSSMTVVFCPAIEMLMLYKVKSAPKSTSENLSLALCRIVGAPFDC